jgi:hypothetical protein
MAKWLLVDGFNLAYRCFFAIPELSRADGFPTNALHGWVKSLWKLADQEKPAGTLVFFDLGGAQDRFHRRGTCPVRPSRTTGVHPTESIRRRWLRHTFKSVERVKPALPLRMVFNDIGEEGRAPTPGNPALGKVAGFIALARIDRRLVKRMKPAPAQHGVGLDLCQHLQKLRRGFLKTVRYKRFKISQHGQSIFVGRMQP